MNLMTAGALGREFKVRTEAAYREALRRHQFELAERERRERREDIQDDAAEAMDFAMSMVTIAEMDEFWVELDHYDTATITALQENERELLIARENLDKLFAKAHVLPDGRKVFETQDGLRVFDQFGQEVPADVIKPDEIDDSRPRWETAKAAIEEHRALLNERAELLEYQGKLDEARERLDKGDMTREEFDKLREDLKSTMPEAVREQFPELEQEQHAEAATRATPAEELDISDDMVPTSSAPKAFVPS